MKWDIRIAIGPTALIALAALACGQSGDLQTSPNDVDLGFVASLATLRTVPRLEDLDLPPILAPGGGGECLDATNALGLRPSKRATILRFQNAGRFARRVLVVVDSAGTVLRYSDMAVASDGRASYVVNLDPGEQSYILTSRSRYVPVHPLDLLSASQLGNPATIIAQVRKQCDR